MGTTSAPNRLRYRVLGPVAARALGDGDEVDLAVGGPRQRRLLAVLLLGEGRLVPMDRLLEAVWGDEPEPPDSAAKVVLSYVSRLRSVVGDGVVVTGEGGYALLRRADDLDADRFGELVVAQRGAPPATALRALDDALSLWHGRALGEFADEPWARGAATRLEELRLVALEGRAQARLDLGAHAEAVPELEGLVVDHPLRERFRAQLMLALHRSGRQAEAMRCFQDHRAYLADETGLEPSRELSELERRIAVDDPGLAFVTAGRTRRGYVLSDVIGEGAFATVYRAVQPSIGREVAVKVVRAELADDPAYIRRFESEARLVARLEHPQIVPLYDYWREPGGAYLVFRYLRGGTAADEPGPWSLARVDQVVADVTGALAAAHDAGVVHRDVKPANILFDEGGRAYLADFGIAFTPGSAGDRSNVVRSAGSPLYASPEQVRDGLAAPASDQYALGVVAWELLTGRAPFDGARLTDLLRTKLERPVPRLGDRRPDVPEAVSDVLQRATAVHPDERYPSVVEFLAAWSDAVARPARRAVATGETLSPAGPVTGGSSDTLARLRLDTVNPYKGLRAFDEADAGEFFGRVDAIDALADLLGERRFVAVVGPSGSGKSSLVRAGLVPRVRAAGTFVAVVVTGSSPVDELADALVQLAVHAPGDLRERLVDEQRLPGIIGELLPDDGSELLVVLDQFEELWTLCEPTVRDRLLAALVAASHRPGSRLRLIVTIRADFFDRPLTHPLVGPLVRDAVYALTPLSVDSLEQAVTAPAARVGVRVEPALVAVLLGDVASEPNGLPLLQYTLTELFDRRDGATMTLATYRRMGGLTGALTNRADGVFDSLDADGRRAAQRLFLRLVAAGEGTADTRRRARRRELATVPGHVVEAFGAARLLSFDVDTVDREPTVEVAHEALIRHWPRLRAWLDEDRDGLRVARHLGEATRAWDARGRDVGDLYRGARLESATGWALTHPDDLNDVEAAFLAASGAERDRIAAEAKHQHRLRRRARRRGVALATAVALLAGGTMFVVRRSTPPAPMSIGHVSHDDPNVDFVKIIDRGFDEAVAAADVGSRTVPVRPPFSADDAIEGLAEEGTDLILVSAITADVDRIAVQHPSTRFVVLDRAATEPNVTRLLVAVNEGSFLAGAAAALTSETGIIGFVGGADSPTIWPFAAGYEAGARWAVPDVDIRWHYLGGPFLAEVSGFTDVDGARRAATEMYDAGADVVFHAAGNAGYGVFDAAVAVSERTGRHRWAIGVDSDQYLTVAESLAPASSRWQLHILTSVLKRTDVGVRDVIATFASGRPLPRTKVYGLAAGGTGLAFSGGYLYRTRALLDDTHRSIAAGEIVVPCLPSDRIATASLPPDYCTT